MKRSSKMIFTLFAALTILLSLSAFQVIAEENENAETQPKAEFDFEIELSVDTIPKAGDTVNVICNIKNIKAENGLMAVSFQLDYNIMKVKPAVISSNPEDCTPYDAFIIKSPQYIMDVNGQEISASCYENISRCYYEGCFQTYYEFKFLDKITYPMIKKGTAPDPVIRNDGDFVLSIPFIVNDDVAVGDDVYFYASAVTGTDAGNENQDPFTVFGSDCLLTFNVIGESTSMSMTETTNAETEITSNIADTTESGIKTTGTSNIETEITSNNTDTTGNDIKTTGTSNIETEITSNNADTTESGIKTTEKNVETEITSNAADTTESSIKTTETKPETAESTAITSETEIKTTDNVIQTTESVSTSSITQPDRTPKTSDSGKLMFIMFALVSLCLAMFLKNRFIEKIEK